MPFRGANRWRSRGVDGAGLSLFGKVKQERCIFILSSTHVGEGLRAPLTKPGSTGITLPMLIFKIFRSNEWAQLRRDGSTTGAPIDVADGYVHFSTATQAAETAAKHFSGADDLFLIAVDEQAAGDALKWEVSRNDALFPHLYREMTLDDVVWAQPLPLENGVHQFPAGLEEAAR